jgi:hypothetical protein
MVGIQEMRVCVITDGIVMNVRLRRTVVTRAAADTLAQLRAARIGLNDPIRPGLCEILKSANEVVGLGRLELPDLALIRGAL